MRGVPTILAVAAVLSCASLAHGEALRAAAPGRLTAGRDGAPIERLAFARGLAPALAALAPEASLRVAWWPVAPGVRRDVVLTRHEVLAPGARVYEVTASGLREVPPDGRVRAWGASPDDAAIRVMVSLDPTTGRLHGFSLMPDGAYELRDDGVEHVVGTPASLLAAGQPEPTFGCGQESLNLLNPLEAGVASAEPLDASAEGMPSLHTATIAVDTDNELMSEMFANSTASAQTYIANLFAGMNVMYERDLNVRLLQGTTYLRTAADPWTVTGSGASLAQLQEFGNYWAANYGSVQRALAMMLSGKSSSGYSGSGIAWLRGLCSSSYGYSFTQMMTAGGIPAIYNQLMVGHELGHNFGAPHTHCHTPPIDTCYAGQSGCYSGATSCPAGGAGTIMSYCHLLSGCDADMVFHARSISEEIDPHMQPKAGVCLFPTGTPVVMTVTGVSPAAGGVWGGHRVAVGGSNFAPGTAVSFGSVAGTSVTYVSPTRLTVTTPAHTVGAVNVSVSRSGATSGTLTNGYTFTSLHPIGMAVDVDNVGGVSSNLNGVLEPGETVRVTPSWQNERTVALGVSGLVSGFGGPGGATYTIADSGASFGTIGAGQTADCSSASGDCYLMRVTAATRPATHWDSTFTEALSAGGRTWSLHLGGSFSDIPSNYMFYREIEGLLHAGVTAGCTATSFCPSSLLTRAQIAMFLARAMEGGDENVPASGTITGRGSYACGAGGTSLFTDVSATAVECRHVHRLAATAVMAGCTATTFCPTANVPRSDMSVFVARAIAGSDAAVPLSYSDATTGRSYSCSAGAPSPYFSDVPISATYCRHAHYVWALGVVNGCAAGPPRYCPTATIIRAQMARFLASGFHLEPYGP